MRFPDRHFRYFGSLAVLVVAAAAEALAENPGQPRRRIVVSIPDRKVAVVEEGRVLKVFPAAVGKPSTPTPAGSFTIVGRIPNPTWYTAHRVVPPGQANPLGTRWIGLSRKGYGIHGTNRPRSIGRRASHGCVRLRNADIEALFDMVAVGDPVELYDSRDPELDAIFGTRQVALQQPPAAPAGGGL